MRGESIRDQLARIRAEQAARPPLTTDEIRDAFATHLAKHDDHPWHQVGRCVYCGPCGTRLYQGTMPAAHERYVPPRKPSKADEMRARWGMD